MDCMGDIETLLISPDNSFLEEELLSPRYTSLLLSNPSPESISGRCWEKAEETANEILKRIQPTVISEERRKAVIEYIQGLLKDCLGGEVFPFGSVPLKTYLPDGDIDLTAISVQLAEDSLANDVRVVLEKEEQRTDAYFEVKHVQYINAEVKVIKCLVENIAVDISFNQLGGLGTLCFLEKVDCLIGNNHLFKRSIILIKAWCYYESRILGSPHGLISTYALEIMVFYIFRLFHSSLNGPLAVLYRFLEYYSKFDWENFGISLNGPISVSSLPEIVAETPDNDWGELFLDSKFLRSCVELLSVPLRGLKVDSRPFLTKHFNIVDPLKENNNLGRSVRQGNFYRIRSAFTYGARKLGQILLLTVEDIRDELPKFFVNTFDRYGSGQRPDMPKVQKCTTRLGSSLEVLQRFGCIKKTSFSGSCMVDEPATSPNSLSDLNDDYKTYYDNLWIARWSHNYSFSGYLLSSPPLPHCFPPPVVSRSASTVEDPIQVKKRGIGTFFPDLFLSEALYKERFPLGRCLPRVPHGKLV